jgi:hypothetical protein
MTIEEQLTALLSPLLPGGLHPHIAPQNSVTPYAIYQEIISPTENTLSDGVPIQQSVMQIDVYDKTYPLVKTASNTLETAMQAAFAAGTLAGVQRSRRSLYEPDPKLHRIMYEFSLWYH